MCKRRKKKAFFQTRYNFIISLCSMSSSSRIKSWIERPSGQAWVIEKKNGYFPNDYHGNGPLALKKIAKINGS